MGGYGLISHRNTPHISDQVTFDNAIADLLACLVTAPNHVQELKPANAWGKRPRALVTCFPGELFPEPPKASGVTCWLPIGCGPVR